MAATAINRPGQDNAAGDAFANSRIVYSGLIAQHYNRGLLFADKLTKRSFPRGAKSFMVKFHDAESAQYHTPGHSIFLDGTYSGNPQKGEREIKLGAKLLKAGLLDEVDEYIQDFDSVSAHSDAIREALQRKDDQLSCRALIAAAARNGGADEYTNEPDLDAFGTTNGILTGVMTGAHDATKADVLKNLIMTAAEVFDRADVPDSERWLALTPFYWSLLFYMTNKDFLNRDYGNNANGSTGERKIMMGGGFKIIRSNNIPTTDLSAEGSRQTELDRDFTGTAGVFFTPQAAVRGVAKEVAFDMWEHKDYRAKAYVAEFLAGFGGWRREGAIWLKAT